ncbi:MAG: NADH-quinone oxidoreductase subunit J [Gemmatimonadales bacterium]
MIQVLFWLFAGVAVASAILCITRRSPVASALWLINTLFAIAALFVILDAQFIAFLQVLVYAGAVMVLFLFVIMLLNLGRPGRSDIKGPAGWLLALVGGGLLLVQMRTLRFAIPPENVRLPPGTMARVQADQGVVAAVANPLFQDYFVPFELTSILLLAAIVGAVVLAKRKL